MNEYWVHMENYKYEAEERQKQARRHNQAKQVQRQERARKPKR